MTDFSDEFDTFLEVAERSSTEPMITEATKKALQINSVLRETSKTLDHDAQSAAYVELDTSVSELMNVFTQVTGEVFYHDSEGEYHTVSLTDAPMRFRGYRFITTPENSHQRVGHGFDADPELLEGTIDPDDLDSDGLYDVSGELSVGMNFLAMSGLRAEALMQLYMPSMLSELRAIVDDDDMTHGEKLLTLRTVLMPRGVDFSSEQHRIAVQSYLSWKLPMDKLCPYFIQANGVGLENEKDTRRPFFADDTGQLFYLEKVMVDKDVNEQYCLQLDAHLIAPRATEEDRSISLPVSTVNLIMSLREQTYRGY